MAQFPRRRRHGSAPIPKAPKALTRSKTAKAAHPVATPADAAPAVAAPRPAATTSRLRRGGVANVAVMTLAAGIVGTIAIPAYAFAPGSDQLQFGATAQTRLTKAQAQDVDVADDVISAPVSNDAYATVTGAQIRAEQEAARQAAEAAAAAEAARLAAEQEMTSYAASYTGPSVDDLLAAPPNASYDLASLYNVATSYIGTPYVYGGATPAGFDCSGFTMYVFAQFGISMPHSSAGQGARGTRISEADAVPGDLVVMSGHIGFYAGNGMILHAPYSGASVRIQPIWTSSYSIVRI